MEGGLLRARKHLEGGEKPIKRPIGAPKNLQDNHCGISPKGPNPFDS